MKYNVRISSLLTIFTLFLCMLFALPLESEAETKETSKLICRSGGNMSIIVSPSASNPQTWLQVRFIKSRFSYVSIKPKPGECTFAQRTVTGEEPEILAVDLKARVWTEFKGIGTGHAEAGVVPSDMYKQDQEMAKQILHQVRSEGYFTVEVYNTGEGYFNIVSISDGVQ